MAKDQPTVFQMARDIQREILTRFRKEDIEIPYPRRYVIFSEDHVGLGQAALLGSRKSSAKGD
ncbi:MAG: hypothetical protein ACE5PO_06310 [Candidatus Bathyarchaeia archaeon]